MWFPIQFTIDSQLIVWLPNVRLCNSLFSVYAHGIVRRFENQNYRLRAPTYKWNSSIRHYPYHSSISSSSSTGITINRLSWRHQSTIPKPFNSTNQCVYGYTRFDIFRIIRDDRDTNGTDAKTVTLWRKIERKYRVINHSENAIFGRSKFGIWAFPLFGRTSFTQYSVSA